MMFMEVVRSSSGFSAKETWTWTLALCLTICHFPKPQFLMGKMRTTIIKKEIYNDNYFIT